MSWDLRQALEAATAAHNAHQTAATARTLQGALLAYARWYRSKGNNTRAQRLESRAQHTAQWAQAQGEMG